MIRNPLFIKNHSDSDRANQIRNILAALENLKVQLGDEFMDAAYKIELMLDDFEDELKIERMKPS